MTSRNVLLSSVVAVALSACGGGGSSSAPAGGGFLAPPGPQGNVQSVPVQRAIATQSLSTVQSGVQVAQFGTGGTGGLSVVRRTIDAVGRQITSAYRTGLSTAPSAVRRPMVTYSACSNGSETATVTVSATEQQAYVRAFYDAACTQLHEDFFLDLVATSLTSVSATGTSQQYTIAGAPFAYNTLALVLTGLGTGSGTFSIRATDAVTATSPLIADAGIACTVAVNALGCGTGAVEHLAPISQDLGATSSITTSASVSGGITTVPINGTASAFSGSLNAMTLSAATFPNWSIAGGTVVDTATVSGQLQFNSLMLLSGGSLTLTDAADLGTAVLTIGGKPAQISGTIAQTTSGARVATFVVDLAGNGTITYSNGVVAQISNWVVLG